MRFILLLSACLFSLSAISKPTEYGTKIIINSKSFKSERTLRVSLPASYDTNVDALYPVIYVVRGQLDLLATIASLNMLDKEAPEFIVAGIDGTLGDFIPSKDGSKTQFSQFIHDEVTPYLEENYRVASYRILTGHSSAAIFSIHDWLADGKSFSKYIVISPPLEGDQIIKEFKTKELEDFKNKEPLLITISDEGEKTEEVFSELGNLVAESDSVSFKRFLEQTHMSGRVNAMMQGLRQEFHDWQPSKALRNGDLDGLVNHYAMLSKRYGFDAVIPLDMLARMSGMDSWADDSEKHKNAAAAVKYVLARNKSDADELFGTAKQLESLGGADASKRLISYICDEAPEYKACVRD